MASKLSTEAEELSGSLSLLMGNERLRVGAQVLTMPFIAGQSSVLH